LAENLDNSVTDSTEIFIDAFE